jgi:predicted transposase YbfD/YdcC
LAAVDPLSIDFPFARTVVIVQVKRTIKKTGQSTTETRYYLSSLEANERSPSQWLGLIRGHWAGVEIRNHWRRDACWGEDRTRSRNPNVLINLASLRNVCLHLLNRWATERPLPDLLESVAANASLALRIIRQT